MHEQYYEHGHDKDHYGKNEYDGYSMSSPQTMYGHDRDGMQDHPVDEQRGYDRS